VLEGYDLVVGAVDTGIFSVRGSLQWPRSVVIAPIALRFVVGEEAYP